MRKIKPPTSTQLNILVIQTAFIGDTILATALLEKLFHALPGVNIDFLIRKGNEGLFHNHPFIRSIFTWDKLGGRKYRTLFSLIIRFRSAHYHYCINLHRHTSTGLVTLLCGARNTIGFTMNPLSRFFTYTFIHKIGVAPKLTHETDLYLQLATPLTSDMSPTMPRLYPPDENVLPATSHSAYVTIAPTSVWFTKQLPAEKWCALIERIDQSISVLLIGAGSDYDHCERIKAAVSHPSVINLAGKLSLLQSAALMKRALMNYANDSSPVHIASSVNAPITAIFCSTVPAFGYGPLGTEGKIVESHVELTCRPCGPHGHTACPEGHFKCGNTIIIEDIPVPNAATCSRGEELK